MTSLSFPSCSFGLLSACFVTTACGSRPSQAPETPGAVSVPVAASAAPASATPVASAASAPPASPAPPATQSGTRDIPGACPAGEASCTPPAAFAEAACRGKFPDLPLLMFAKGTPWPRMYVKAEWVEPVNPYGGERNETWLHFGEELLILKEHVAGGSTTVKVSGPADVDVLRWDGTCATIRKEMLVSYVPAPMDGMFIVLKYLDGGIQEALLKDELVLRAHEGERRDCRGSSVTHPSDPCKKALRKLTDVIILAVKKGIALPTPERRPEWKK